MGVARLVDELETGTPEQRFAAIDALEHHGRTGPHELIPYRERLLRIIRSAAQPGVQWHLAEIAPRLHLNGEQAEEVAFIMRRWIDESPSSIVKADALTAVSRLANQYPAQIMGLASRLLADAVRNGSSAERARARSLVKRYHGGED